MRHTPLAALIAILAAALSPAAAQTPNPPAPERPIDKGPATPGANDAYQGGGVVLQGAPGAPPPAPQPTPQGAAPQGAVPQGAAPK